MKKLLMFLAVPCILGTVAIGRAWAMNDITGSTCSSPQPYNGGGSVSKFFTEPDGSGVTITSTGAVIKQGPCGTPYREGWVNPNSISSINSSSEIPTLQSGATNPFVSNNKTSTSNQSSSSSTSTKTITKVVIVKNNTPAQTQAATTTAAPTTTTAAATTSLPNTGPGNVLAIGAITSVLGTVGHFLYRNFRYRLG